MRPLRAELLEDRRLLSIDSPTIELFGTSPAVFVENQGQWADASVRFLHQGNGANVAMTDAGPVFQLFRSESKQSAEARREFQALAALEDARWPAGRQSTSPTGGNGPLDSPHGWGPSPFSPLETQTVSRFSTDDLQTQMLQFSAHFEGANPVAPLGLDRAPTAFHYFVGDETAWASDVPGYETVAYENLYEGIDLHAWGLRSHLKYEFHVAPGADYGQIRIRYEGIEGLTVDSDGALHVGLGDGWKELVDDVPYLYQIIEGRQTEVAGRFERIDDATYAFAVTGPYDPNTELVIDPDLSWSTYLGGSGSDEGNDIAVDAAGNSLVTGTTYSSDFEGTDNAGRGGRDAFVAKLSPDGDLLWSAQVGGSGAELGWDIAVDTAGNALVTGHTTSTDFANADNTNHGDRDAFVFKLSPTGGHLWSTYLGGGRIDAGWGIAVDAADRVLVTGYTESTDFQGAGNASHGDYDVFVTKLSPDGSQLWSTYVGGSGSDGGGGIAVDAAGNALVTGGTNSTDFQDAGGANHGLQDAFVFKLSPSGGLLWSNYVGGSGEEEGTCIAVDSAGNALITGSTRSVDLLQAGNSKHGGWDAFVAKVSPDAVPLWSTYVGGDSDDFGRSLAVDLNGNPFVTGLTFSTNFQGAVNAKSGSEDAFVANLSSSGGNLWARYFGSTSHDAGNGIAVDRVGNVLVAGSTDSTDLANAGNANHGLSDGFVLKLIDPTAGAVVGRRLFYNGSTFHGAKTDGNEPDDAIIAPDKQALLPGGTASFENYTSYDKGISGILVDIAGPVDTDNLSAADFRFRVGNSPDCDDWEDAPDPLSISVGEGAGVDDSHRVTIRWEDGAIRSQWLQVVVKATHNTGLAMPDIFYFGNAPGEAGDQAINTIVNATDEIGARNFRHGPANPATIDDRYDYNRDGLVNATDQVIARNNQTNPLSMLRLIAAPNYCDPAFARVFVGVPGVVPALAPEETAWVMGPPASAELPTAEVDWLFEFEEINWKDTRRQ